jgi:hypothetical protein
MDHRTGRSVRSRERPVRNQWSTRRITRERRSSQRGESFTSRGLRREEAKFEKILEGRVDELCTMESILSNIPSWFQKRSSAGCEGKPGRGSIRKPQGDHTGPLHSTEERN